MSAIGFFQERPGLALYSGSETLVEQQDDFIGVSRHPEWYAGQIDTFEAEMHAQQDAQRERIRKDIP